MKNRIEVLSKKGYLPKHTPENLDKTVTGIVKLLSDRHLKIATAESCTGGMISQLITSVPNASAVFDMGVCTYANSAKIQLLGVNALSIENHGVVSSQVALEMAKGIRLAAKSDIGVSVTGIAGPSGGTAQKPVGTVYCGFSYADTEFACLLKLSELNLGDRQDIRKYTCQCVFEILTELISDNE